MGEYSEYIWTAYGVTALAIMGAIFVVWRAYVRARDQAAELEAVFVKRVAYTAPIVLFGLLAFTLWYNLEGRKPFDEIPSALVGEPAPSITLPPLYDGGQGLGPTDLKTGRVTVVNVFASWCVPCRQEAPQLARLAQAYHVRLVGIAYKDKPEDARGFLGDYGNPYERVGVDADGRAGILWGIYKVPESFVVDGQGRIRGRFGPLTPEYLLSDVLPAIEKAARS